MTHHASSSACSTWTLEELATLADGSVTEQGDVPQHSLLLQDSPEEFIESYDGQTYGMGFNGLMSPTSTSLAAVGGQFSDGQSAGQTGSSGHPRIDPAMESNSCMPTDLGTPVYDIIRHDPLDQPSVSRHVNRRFDSACRPGRRNRPSLKESFKSTPMSVGLSNESTSTANTRYSGGRTGPLTTEQRQHAKDVRAMHACWRCHSLKARCDIGNPCRECLNRKSCKSWIRGCERTALVELLVVFLPEFLVGHHRTGSLQLYLAECDVLFIPNSSVIAYLTYGLGPPFEIFMYEISTSDCSTHMWCYNERLTKHERRRENLVPLAMTDDAREGVPDLVESHIAYVLEHMLEELPKFYYAEVGKNRLQADLLKLICIYYGSARGKNEQIGHALKLLLLALIMGQTMYLTEQSRRELELELQSWPNPSQCLYPMPRIAQRQFKYMVHQMVHNAMRDVLEDLHDLIWKKKKSEWTTTFCVLVLLGITAEDLQISLMLVAISAQVNADLGQASHCIRAMDETGFGLPLSLFENAYGKFNPLTGPFTEKVKNKLEDDDSIELIRGVRELIKRESILLRKVKETKVLPAPDSFSVDNISRLVSRVLPDP